MGISRVNHLIRKDDSNLLPVGLGYTGRWMEHRDPGAPNASSSVRLRKLALTSFPVDRGAAAIAHGRGGEVDRADFDDMLQSSTGFGMATPPSGAGPATAQGNADVRLCSTAQLTF
jgi:hypothetical protein